MYGVWKQTWLLERLFQGTCRYEKWKVLEDHKNEAALG